MGQAGCVFCKSLKLLLKVDLSAGSKQIPENPKGGNSILVMVDASSISPCGAWRLLSPLDDWWMRTQLQKVRPQCHTLQQVRRDVVAGANTPSSRATRCCGHSSLLSHLTIFKVKKTLSWVFGAFHNQIKHILTSPAANYWEANYRTLAQLHGGEQHLLIRFFKFLISKPHFLQFVLTATRGKSRFLL